MSQNDTDRIPKPEEKDSYVGPVVMIGAVVTAGAIALLGTFLKKKQADKVKAASPNYNKQKA
jgi:hypothetical protein